ncbi:MAG: T9SS type A sorting domain-containing protein [Flavobacteriaceae bacterium]
MKNNYHYKGFNLFFLLLQFTISAQVIFDIDSVSQHLLPRYGYNMTYADNGQGIVDINGNFVADRIGLISEIKPHWIRFPGGTVSHTYKWKHAIGPQNARIDQVHPFHSRFDGEPSTFGPDEVAQFTEDIGAKTLMVVSWNATAQDAADLVEYMNALADGSNVNGGIDWAAVRATNGRQKPYNILYWEIGNEGGSKDITTWTSWPYSGDDITGVGGVNQGSDLARNWWVNGGIKKFTNQKAVLESHWGIDHNRNDNNDKESVIKTNALANQKYYVKFPPITHLTLRIGTSSDATTTWAKVADFRASSSTDFHYTLNDKTGEIVFGDGFHGKIPDANNFVFLDYTSGPHDGSKGIITAMKAVDPRIKIGVSHWAMNDEALKDSCFVYDGFQVHGAGFLGSRSSPTSNTNPLDEASARGVGTIGHVLSENNLQLTTLNRKIFATEYTINGGYKIDNKFYAHTIVASISSALSLIKGSENPLVEILGTNYLLNSLQASEVHITSSNIVSSKGRAVQMFTNDFGDYFLNTTPSNLTQRTVSYYKFPGVTTSLSIQNVYTLSSMTKDSINYYTLLVNTTDENITVTLNYPKFMSPQKKWELTGNSLTAINDVVNPNRVGIVETNLIKTETNSIEVILKPASVTKVKVVDNNMLSIYNFDSFKELIISPNPVKNDFVEIIGTSTKEINLNEFVAKIYSLDGVLQKEVLPKDNVVYIGNLNSGIYFLKLQSNQRSFVLKFIRL